MPEILQRKYDNCMSKVLIICPVYNEAHHLEALINEFQQTDFIGDLLFVNSGFRRQKFIIN